MFTLNSLEELQLWMESLGVYFRRAGRLFDSESDPPEDHNFRSEMRNALLVLRDEIGRCPKILCEELRNEELPPRLEVLSEEEIKNLILKTERLASSLGDLVHFWEALQRLAIIGLSIARHQFLSKPEFKAFGLLLEDKIRWFAKTKSHALLARRRSNLDFHHMLQQDILGPVRIQTARQQMERVFYQFFEVLSTVQYCQEQIQLNFEYQKLTVLLNCCYAHYQDLLNILDQVERRLTSSHPTLAEAVRSVKFGLRIEIRRVFGQELRIVSSEAPLQDVYSNIESGLGLLQNASRQSFTSLARQLNRQFDELKVFHELKDQESAALRLIQELNELYELAKSPETLKSREKFAELVSTLRVFRNGTMRLLYFNDWKPFEQFSRELESPEDRDRAFILHRFEVYLSTLVGEVSKRAVLHRGSIDETRVAESPEPVAAALHP